MARQLIEQGDSVPAVFMIEARAPHVSGEPAADERDTYLTFDRTGASEFRARRDLLSDAELRYMRAMERYIGQPCAIHMVIIRSQRRNDDAQRDLDWSRLAATSELHVLPGDHLTLVSRHVGELAGVIRDTIGRAVERSGR